MVSCYSSPRKMNAVTLHWGPRFVQNNDDGPLTSGPWRRVVLGALDTPGWEVALPTNKDDTNLLRHLTRAALTEMCPAS